MDLDSFEKDGVTYFELYTSCPICLDRGNQEPRSYWSHCNNNCNGHIYIGDNGTLLCPKCGVNSRILNWRILCPQCNHDDSTVSTLEEVSDEGMQYIHAVAMSSAMVQKTGIAWLQTFLSSFMKEENE